MVGLFLISEKSNWVELIPELFVEMNRHSEAKTAHEGRNVFVAGTPSILALFEKKEVVTAESNE